MEAQSNNDMQFQPEQLEALVKLLKLHYAHPLRYPLSGTSFEIMFAMAVNGEKEDKKLFFDVKRDAIGWSLKTLDKKLGPNRNFEVVIQRCDILKSGDITLASPADELGSHILARFYKFYEGSRSRQKIQDSRSAFLLRKEANERITTLLPQVHNLILFQESIRLYSANDIMWSWANDNGRSLIGRLEGKPVLRWYRSGTQLFGIYYVPEDAHSIDIPAVRSNLEQWLTQFGVL